MPNPTPKQILSEARALLEQTYWCQDTEFEYVRKDDLDEVPKYLELGKGPNKEYVSSVCSIGAIAVAHCQKTESDELFCFNYLFDTDWNTMRAGYALAAEVWSASDISPSEPPADIIADWNDTKSRTRAQVLKAFAKALESPLLTAKSIWLVSAVNAWEQTWDLHAWPCASKVEAEALKVYFEGFLGNTKKPKKIYQDIVEILRDEECTLSVTKVEAPVLVSA
jgi:hypothetical protein